MKSLNKLTIILTAILFIPAVSFAQGSPAEGSFGLRASLDGQASIELPYQLNENLSIAPALTFSGQKDNFTTLRISVLPRYYTNTSGSLTPYVMGNLGFSNTSFNGGGSSTFFILGIGYGGEYFFSEQFSISADAGLNANVGGDIVNSLNTGARVSASVYF